MTRKIVASMQISLDGMAERANGATDWIGSNPDTFDWELFDRVDACVLGRAMYPDYEQYWRAIIADPATPLAATGAIPTTDEIRYAKFADRTTHYVLTHSPDELDWPVAQAIGDLGAVQRLRESPGRDIYVVGGPTTVGNFVERGLLDELRLTVHPVVLGGGTPLFGRVSSEHRFALVGSQQLDDGLVRLVYQNLR
ncbi:dihydrofolate reductase family protein [Mycobacterium riyadhense]|uniref:dihydrofolate reductase family protein n=1 Tax=Mycobacterium riyadhense TaxID=486698 RepID=UPI001957EC64|nr:dihydrofolate reductase family protein [Mycobacterium riyadhense]